MVQFRDIFPALLLVGCAGKTVLFCRLYSGSLVLLLGVLIPPCPSFIEDRRRSSSLPGRSSGVLCAGCGGSPGRPPMLISLHPLVFVSYFVFK